MANRETLRKLVDRLEPKVRDALIQSIDGVKSDIQISLLIAALRDNDLPRALDLIRLDRGYFEPLDRALAAAYAEAGNKVFDEVKRKGRTKGVQVRGSFDVRNPAAEEWLSTQSSKRIVEIQETTRTAAMSLMERNQRLGTSPRTTALDLVGRVNKATGKREGGIIGLHDKFKEYRNAAQDELSSVNRRQLKNYLSRKTRDRRFDGAVHRAVQTGERIPADQSRKMIAAMERKMLKVRGEAIARTELLESTRTAEDRSLQQLVESGQVQQQNIKSKWDASGDSDTRASHRAMDGQVRGQGEPFKSGDGYLLLHPGDRSLGAPAEELINCRCLRRIDIDFLQQAADDERARM